MTCPSCHEPLPEDAAFCPKCGTDPKAFQADRFDNRPTVVPAPEPRTGGLEPGTRFANRYDIVRKLGQGGMGVVYVAVDSNTGGEIALKLIHPHLVSGEDAVKRLISEGLLARQISHPNIVAVYDVSQWDGQPYITMELVKGGSLRKWMTKKRGTDVPLATAAGLISNILAGLGEAHRREIVHRDLKPENVMLGGDPDSGDLSLRILDFGIAKAVGARAVETASGGMLGTPDYMAPEQVSAADAVGPQADLYAVSVIFYELLMEAVPSGYADSLAKSRPDVPKAVEALIEKGLSNRARSRPASVADYKAALDAAVGSVPKPVNPFPPPGPSPVPPAPPSPPHPPSPPPPGPADKRGFLASMTTKTKVGLGVGVLVVLAIIGSMSANDQDGDGVPDETDRCVTQAGPRPTGCPIITERWRDNFGNVFSVERIGSTFSGEGNVPGTGAVELDGEVTPTGASITIESGSRTIFQGAGTIGPSETGGIDAVFGSFRFHINH